MNDQNQRLISESISMTLNILFPVLNEEARLRDGIERTIDFLKGHHLMAYQLTIVDNGSVDNTRQIAETLCKTHACVRYIRIEERGVGAAFRAGVKANNSDIVGYMDVDLSTDITHLTEMMSAFLADTSLFMVNGSRLNRASEMRGRKWYRNLSSYGLATLLKIALGMRATDGICGFKFYRAKDLPQIMAYASDEKGWFYIIELLLRAERKGLKILELPIIWEDDHRTTVKFFAQMRNYLYHIMRLRGVFKKEERTK